MPFSFIDLAYLFFKLSCNRYPDGKPDDTKALVLPLGAIAEKLLLVCCRIAPEIDLLYSLRQYRKRFLEYPQVLKACRHIPIPKLGMRHYILFCPAHREGLKRLVAFIAVQGILLRGFDNTGIHFHCCLSRGA